MGRAKEWVKESIRIAELLYERDIKASKMFLLRERAYDTESQTILEQQIALFSSTYNEGEVYKFKNHKTPEYLERHKIINITGFDPQPKKDDTPLLYPAIYWIEPNWKQIELTGGYFNHLLNDAPSELLRNTDQIIASFESLALGASGRIYENGIERASVQPTGKNRVGAFEFLRTLMIYQKKDLFVVETLIKSEMTVVKSLRDLAYDVSDKLASAGYQIQMNNNSFRISKRT